MDSDDRAKARAILNASPWLRDHGPDLVGAFLTHGRLAHLKAGQWAHGEGDDEAGVLVMVEGAAQMFCQAPGEREVLIGQAGPGVAIGQTLRFGGGPRLVTVICTQDCLVLQASDRALARIGAEQPRIWEAVAALLYLQLRGVLQMVAQGAALPPRQRIAGRLDLLTRASRGEPVLKLSQQALGEMLGLTRKTVNAYLGQFEREGLIRRAYGVVILLDRPGLRRVAAL